MKSLNIGSIFTDAFKDVWKVHKWAVELLFRPLKNNTQKTNVSNNSQKPVAIREHLNKSSNNKKANSNRVQLSSSLSTKLNNR